MKKRYLFIYLIILLYLLGCNKLQKNESIKFEKKEIAPKTLEELNKGIQDILKDVKTVEEIIDGTYVEEKPDIDKAKEQEKKEEKLLTTWNRIDKEIQDLHEKWNGYQGEKEKKTITQEKIDGFTGSLNLLTKAIENKQVNDIYNYGSLSQFSLSPILELYKDEIQGELNRIKFSIYQSYLKAKEGLNVEAALLLDNYEAETSKIRLKLDKDDKKLKQLDKIEISIEEMAKSLKENSIKLTRIKRDVTIKNLEELGK